MSELLQNPAIQSGVLPFIASLLASLVLLRTRLCGWVFGVGFLSMVAVSTGFSINWEAMTSFHKMVVSATLWLAVIAALEYAPDSVEKMKPMVASGLAAAAALWMSWRILQQQEGGMLWLHAGAIAAYAGGLVFFTTQTRTKDTLTASASTVVLGLTVAGMALLGASALLAFCGISIAAAGGALVLVQIFWQRPPVHFSMISMAGLGCSLASISSVLTGQLKWYSLLPALAIPLITRIPQPESRSPWLQTAITSALALIPAALCLALAWYGAGAGASDIS